MAAEPSVEWDSSVIAKARKMNQKTVELRQRFNLPGTESVVQDYYCSLKRPGKAMNNSGRIWITQNYICFYSGLPFKVSEVVSFRKVTSIQQEKNKVLKNAITLSVDEGKGTERPVTFLSFLKTQEALNIMMHLWNNPPTYIQLDETDGSVASSSSSSGAGGFGGRGSQASASTSRGGDGWDNYGQEGADQSVGGGFFQKQSRVQVDTQAAEEALRTAMAAREMGIDTMEELSRQAEVIDRIDHTVENIHANLDKGDRVLRGLESFGGGVKNTFSRDRTRKNNPVFRRLDRTLHLRDQVPVDIDVNILIKQVDDMVVPGTFRFAKERFMALGKGSETPDKDKVWDYRQVAQIVLRARPLHVDLRFYPAGQGQPPPTRFRMMTSFCQPITNELFLRCLQSGNVEIQVLFEPGIPQFHYGSYKLSLIPTAKDRTGNNTSGFGVRSSQQSGGAVFRKQIKNSDLLSKDVDIETKEAFDQQERTVEQIISVANDLQGIAGNIGEELERSSEVLDNITGRTAEATHRVHHSNFRVKQML